VSETAPRRYLFSQFANASLVLLVPTNCRSKTKFLFQEREKRKMGGYSLGSAFDSKSEQMIMVALLLMVGSFYTGTRFGNNNASIYVSQLSSSSNSSSSHGMFFLSFLKFVTL
jgi:hypothetical protein